MRNKGLIYLLILVLFSGCVNIRLRTANENYALSAYAPAVEDYEFVLSKRFERDAAINLADCYYNMGNAIKTEFWYKKLFNYPNPKVEWNYRLGDALIKNGKYQEAKKYLEVYAQVNVSDNKIKNLLAVCDSSFLFYSDTLLYSVKPIRYCNDGVNVFSPTYFKNGILFVSDMHHKGMSNLKSDITGNQYFDLFYGEKSSNGSWMEAVPLDGDVNGKFNEGPLTYDGASSKIYFTRNNYISNKIEKNKKSFNVLKIFEASIDNNTATIIGPLKLGSDEYSVGHPAINSKGDVMYFIANLPWGYGGTDIYKTTKVNNVWSAPENLGSAINSSGNEMFPFVFNDSTIYFSSDGNFGLGGLDIYESNYLNGAWTAPYNIGYPVNSSQDDFGYICDSTGYSGLFSTSRGDGFDKIYEFKRVQPQIVVRVEANDQLSHDAVANASVSVFKDGKLYKKYSCDADGSLALMVEPDHTFEIKCRDKMHYQKKFTVDTHGAKQSDTVVVKFDLKPIEINKPFIWYGISFSKKTTNLLSSSEEPLQLLAAILKDNPGVKVQIGSYTDVRGGDAEKKKLTTQRAELVKQQLIKAGVSATQMDFKGYGSAKILNQCKGVLLCIEEDHQVNNRIEITVLSVME
jgi:outer membrane protein OmpA-like peptidoglycan-associated protein/tetratricopeptide (TPR) repeat protein